MSRLPYARNRPAKLTPPGTDFPDSRHSAVTLKRRRAVVMRRSLRIPLLLIMLAALVAVPALAAEQKKPIELKVGDKVTFKYHESMVIQVKKPGEAGMPSGDQPPAIARNATAKPSGSITEQTTATVTVNNVDTKTGAITVTTEDGRSMSFKVKDKGNLKGVNPGDKISITYTTALLIAVE